MHLNLVSALNSRDARLVNVLVLLTPQKNAGCYTQNCFRRSIKSLVKNAIKLLRVTHPLRKHLSVVDAKGAADSSKKNDSVGKGNGSNGGKGSGSNAQKPGSS